MTKVAILGGGIGGLSAAHELAERGFEVEVYEAGRMWGGKARSILWDQADKDKRCENDGLPADQMKMPVPSEHGFRFFPAFYKHLPDTMKRIPVKDKAKTVFGNLVGTTEVGIFQKNAMKIVLPGRYPTSWTEWEQAFYYLLHAQFNIPDDEMKFFVEKLLVILTSCQERRVAEYEKIDWWTFIEAERFSTEYKKVFGVGLTRSLVAMRAEVASTRTVGDILLQLMLYMFVMDVNDDRVLNAPTNDAWLHPWIEHLEGQKDRHGKKLVNLHLGAETLRLKCDGSRITGATIKFKGDAEKSDEVVDVQADYYICAFPVEVMARLLKEDQATPESTRLAVAAPSLAGVPRLGTEWMNGIQFYLKRKVPVVQGHVIYLDSAWALTSISQQQFWADVDLAKYGDGSIKDILSVDVSNFTAPGTETTDKPARYCTKSEIAREVWAQLKAHLNKGEIVLEDKDCLNADGTLNYYVDPDITFGKDKEVANAEPLLVNIVNSWHNRPKATLEIPNLLLASDYVQTNTDLATMEGANEAARRAVNAILEQLGSTQLRCQIWPLEEPDMFAPLRDYDRLRFSMGLPHVPRSWLTLSLAGSYYWGNVLSEAIATPLVRAGWKTGGALAAPVLRAGWNIGGAITLPFLQVGWNLSGTIATPVLRKGVNTARVIASLLNALTREPPKS